MVIAVLGCARNHPPEVAAMPSGPSSGRTGMDCSFWASATDPDRDDKVAVRFDWGDGDTSNWSGFVPSADSAGKTHAYATPGTFFVRAQARDLDRAVSDWSSACSVVVLLDSNMPPQTPSVPSGPYYGQAYSTYTFSSSAVDPDNDSVCIRFTWGDGDTSDWSSFVPSGNSVYASHYFSSTDTYEISAQAEDKGGTFSGWSGPHVFIVTASGNEPPDIPMTPSGPSVGGIGASYDFTSSATDPDWDNVSIRFAWGDGDTSAWSAYDGSGYDVTMSHTYADSGVFLVTAQAKDIYGYLSQWSPAHTVAISSHLPPGTLKWRYQTYDYVRSSPAVGSDGTVYVGSEDYYLYAVNSDGTLKWRYETGDYVYSSPAVGSDGTVYVGSDDYYLYAVNSDGSLKWRYPTGDYVYASPAIGSDGTVYAGSYDGYLYAINSGGALKWSYQTGGSLLSSPVVGSDGTVYVGSDDYYLYAIHPDGTLKWRYQTYDYVRSSPAIGSDGTIYVGSEDNYLYAIHPDGTLKWRYAAGSDVYSSPAVGSDGTIYVGSGDYYLYAVNSDGTLKWRYPTDGEVWSSPALGSDGTIYAGSDEGYLYAVSSDGTLKWRYEAGDWVYSSPAVGSDSTIYVGSDDGYLYAITGSSPLATSAWPRFHHDLKNTGRVGGP